MWPNSDSSRPQSNRSWLHSGSPKPRCVRLWATPLRMLEPAVPTSSSTPNRDPPELPPAPAAPPQHTCCGQTPIGHWQDVEWRAAPNAERWSLGSSGDRGSDFNIGATGAAGATILVGTFSVRVANRPAGKVGRKSRGPSTSAFDAFGTDVAPPSRRPTCTQPL